MLISSNQEDQGFASEIATSIGVPFLAVPSSKEAVPALAPDGQDILFVDISTEAQCKEFSERFKDRIGTQPGNISARNVHIITGEEIDWISSLVNASQFGHVVIRKYGNVKEAGQYYSRLVKSLRQRGEFGMESLLTSCSGISIMKINHSTEKSNILEKIRKFLMDEAAFSERVVEIVLNGVDEILMNAIYDAPVDESGNQRLAKIPRDTPIALDERTSVELQTGFDGEHVAFKVVDRFGSLERKKLLKHLFSSHDRTQFELNSAVANAGIGLATTFRTGASLMFLSEKGVRTEVTTFFKLSKSFREFKNQFRFVSIHVGG